MFRKNLSINLHKYIFLPNACDLYSFFSNKYSLSIDAVIFKVSIELLSIGQDELSLSGFIITVEMT